MGERQTERESPAGSMLGTDPNVGFKLTILRSRPKQKTKSRMLKLLNYPGTQEQEYLMVIRKVLVKYFFIACFPEKVKWVTNDLTYFASQIVYNSSLSTKLKGFEMSADRSLKIIFDDRSVCNFGIYVRKNSNNWVLLL